MSGTVKMFCAVLVAGILYFAYHYLLQMAVVLANVVR